MPPGAGADEPVVLRHHAWVGGLFALVGLGLVPWTVYLVWSLPSRHVETSYYSVAWGGFDVALAVALIATGVGLFRRRPWVQAVAAAAATLLICDAWFDVLGSHAGQERLVAILMAVGGELPAAAFCLFVALQMEEAAERAHAYAQAARLRARGYKRRVSRPSRRTGRT